MDLIAALIGLFSIVLFVIFWYHISGIHKEAKRSADYLESIDQSVHLFESRDRVGR